MSFDVQGLILEALSYFSRAELIIDVFLFFFFTFISFDTHVDYEGLIPEALSYFLRA
jgi:hypothetical protein